MRNYFSRTYDLSSCPKLAELFKKFAQEGLTPEVDAQFNLLASGGVEIRKDYGNIALLAGNLILYDIFQDGAIIKIGDELFFPRQFDSEKSKRHLEVANEKKASCLTALKGSVDNGRPKESKELAEYALNQLEYINCHNEISRFLDKCLKKITRATEKTSKEIIAAATEEVTKEISGFLEDKKISADLAFKILLNLFYEQKWDSFEIMAEILLPNARLMREAMIDGTGHLLSKFSFIRSTIRIDRVALEEIAKSKTPPNYEAKLEYGRFLFDLHKDFSGNKEAIKFIEEVADDKDSPPFAKRSAAHFLGLLYAKNGKAEDGGAAFHYIKIASDLGLSSAKYDLASLYRKGYYREKLYVAADSVKALQLYKDAASCDDSKSCIVLAIAFGKGKEAPSDVDAKSASDSDLRKDCFLVEKDLARSMYYWQRYLEIIPVIEQNQLFRRQAAINIEAIKQEIAKEDKKEQVALREQLFDVRGLGELFQKCSQNQNKKNVQLLHDAMVKFFIETIDTKEFLDHAPEFSQIEEIVKKFGDQEFSDVEGLGLEARTIMDIKSALSLKDSKKHINAKKAAIKNLESSLRLRLKRSSKSFFNENDKLFWEKTKGIVGKLREEVLKRESLLQSQEEPSSSEASRVTDSGLEAVSRPASSLAEPKAPTVKPSSVVALDEAPLKKNKKPASESEEDKAVGEESKKLSQLIANYKASPKTNKEALRASEKELHDFVVEFFFKAIDENKFPEQIADQISSFSGFLSEASQGESGSKVDTIANDLISKIKVIVKIKTALFSSAESKRNDAAKYLGKHFPSIDEEGKNSRPGSLDELFWKKVKRVASKIQMDAFLKNPLIKSKADLPIFLRIILDKLIEKNCSVFLKGSCINSSISKRPPADLDVDIFAKSLYEMEEERIKDSVKKIFDCEVGPIFKRGATEVEKARNVRKTITVSFKDEDLRADFSLYDSDPEFGPPKESSWSNSIDAKRLEICNGDEVNVVYVEGFNEYLESEKISFNQDSDFLLNPVGRDVILRACFAVATGAVAIEKLLEELQRYRPPCGLFGSLKEELKLKKESPVESLVSKIDGHISKHLLGFELRKVFILSLEAVVELIVAPENKTISNYCLQDKSDMDKIMQAIEFIKKECGIISSSPKSIAESASASNSFQAQGLLRI